MGHISVLLKEVTEVLAPVDGGRYFDGTLGGGGHARAILEASAPGGCLAGTDLDPAVIERLENEFAPYGERVHLIHANFSAIDTICAGLDWQSLNGIILDLGLSSLQLADAARGFAFSQAGPLDMRFSPDSNVSAHTIVNTYDEHDLTRIIRTLGEERFASRIAHAIVTTRPIETTTELADCVSRAIPRRFWPPHIHPATRTFQALRMEVNTELENLKGFLPKAARLLAPGGVLAVIAFHSLEDRIVKQFFAGPESREHHPVLPVKPVRTGPILERITKKSAVPSVDEIHSNPRARSARLRAARRVA
ncbi:MAG: 16S rRNA (cytosine(1402)-N(4))-methyltransferase RsmH [Syntrophaceae bacterium]